jgi:hypothetical protein
MRSVGIKGTILHPCRSLAIPSLGESRYRRPLKNLAALSSTMVRAVSICSIMGL